jgi:phosphoserine phosphatase
MKKLGELYVISGIGHDVTGLVSLVTSIISDEHGNIIDLEERVFHGFFSILLTVDLSEARISGPQFVAKMQAVAHQSGLHIIAERYRLIPRARGKRMMRLALIGSDHSGIVSAATFVLANNGINIERARMIARGELFAMEMELDRGLSPVSIEELEKDISREMERFKIRCFFQTDDVYEKRKRFLIINRGRSMLERNLCGELLALGGNEVVSRKNRAAALKGMSLKEVGEIADGLRLSADAEVLLYTLKLMGFSIYFIIDGFDLFLNSLRRHIGVDHVCSNRLLVDEGKLTGGMKSLVETKAQREMLVASVAKDEKVGESDIITVGDWEPADVKLEDCGIHFILDKRRVLDLLSRKVVTPAQIPAIVSAFGLPAKARKS